MQYPTGNAKEKFNELCNESHGNDKNEKCKLYFAHCIY